eukprot:TRINITY_DN5144_c0_g1_i2.p1 TRINITY_DN5144_c0_g1~~TRINITY_DN5144_c0_g1_i2.p1  ORF type:complete len:830 (+),score=127.23 TRINITY_DN5144_c0_g1_i2:87-2576(+)
MGVCTSKHEPEEPTNRATAVEQVRQHEVTSDGSDGTLQTFSVAGTFSSWQPCPMTWDGESFNYTVSVGDEGWEAFQILQDDSWQKVIYPSVKDAHPCMSHSLQGPDDMNAGFNWLIGKVGGFFGSGDDVISAGTEFKIKLYLDRQGRPESVNWNRLTGSARLDGVHEQPDVTYAIAGTWNEWQVKPMQWDGKLSCFTCTVRLGKSKKESFQFLENGSWDKVVYPSLDGAHPYMSYKLLGPDNSNKGLNWTLGNRNMSVGTKFKVNLFVDGQGRPRHVSWDTFTGARANAPTVICIAGLASGSLQVKPENAETDPYQVCWVSVSQLIQRPVQTFDQLRLRLVEGMLSDGSRVKCTANNEGCDVRPFPGLDGIKDLNPTGHIRVPVWSPLIEELEGDFSWHAFNYDWRRWGDQKYAEDLVDQFREKVQHAIEMDAHPSGKASLVCHSMGCPVALYVLSVLGDDWAKKHISQLILVGPAHMGSPAMMSSYAHAPFVDTQSWVPIPVAFDKTLGDLTATWACMIAEMPMLVGGELPWPEEHIFASTPEKDYTLKDIGQFLEDVASCKANRETGPALWSGVQKLASMMKAPAVPTSIIYSDRLDTPSQIEYESSDLCKKPKLKSSAPGDGTIVASSVEAIGHAWRSKGCDVKLIKDPGSHAKPPDHKELIGCPFSVGVISRLLEGKPLTPITVTVVGASGLKNADGAFTGLSDPYCRFEILGKPSTRRQTDIIVNNLDPVWNFTGNVYAYAAGDDLTFSVFDHDPGFSEGDFLGHVTLPSAMIEEEFHGTLELQDGQGTLTVQISKLTSYVAESIDQSKTTAFESKRRKALGGA